MNMQIQPYETSHLDSVFQLSLRAWAPVFSSMRTVMNPDVYQEFYPDGWRKSQQKVVADACAADDIHVWVATADNLIIGFVAVKLHAENKMGEIYLIAVDPNHQRRGVATALTDFALSWMKSDGMSFAMVETGGDAGHEPARRTYEKSGFDLFPIARYFKKL